jgi:hypothetical protein
MISPRTRIAVRDIAETQSAQNSIQPLCVVCVVCVVAGGGVGVMTRAVDLPSAGDERARCPRRGRDRAPPTPHAGAPARQRELRRAGEATAAASQRSPWGETTLGEKALGEKALGRGGWESGGAG